MKILHVAPDRGAASVVAPLVHGIARDVTLTWVATPAAALQWLHGNRDAAAVIVEIQAQSCASFVTYLRQHGLTTPVVVVAGSARLEPALAALNSGADGYVVAGRSLERDLPRVVAAAVERERERARQQLTRLQEVRRRTQQRATSELDAAAERLAEVQARHSESLARETGICLALQQRLLELERAVRKADERRASEAVSFAGQLAKRHAEFTSSLAQATQSRDAVAAELSVATAALAEVRQARGADAVAATDELRRQETEFRARLAEALSVQTALDEALAEADAAQQETRQRAEIDLAAANERQAALEDLLAQEADRRASLDRTLTAAEAAHEEADRRHAAELTRATAGLADLQARHDAALEAHAVDHVAFERRTADAASALERATRERAAEAAAAASRLASIEAELVHRLTRESTARAGLERALTEARLKSVRGRGRSLSVISAHRQRARKQKERFEAHLTSERTVADRERRAKDEVVRQLQLEQETLQRRLGATHDQLQHLHGVLDDERQAHELARVTSESELQRVSAEYGQIRESFDRLQSAFQTLEQIAGEHATERARLETVVADRDSRLSAQAERQRLAEQDAHERFAELQGELRQALDAGRSERARLQQEIDALRKELDATWTHAEGLRGVAERVPDLQGELERSRNERRRQFERAPYPLCRCSESGAITEANHSFVTLLGCRRVDEVQNRDFVAAALDSAGDLGWLLERARTTRKTETVETQWKTRQGRRLVVRLQALVTATGSIDIAVEDLTGVRALEERLRQAERMEAVGRLASEVAVTCDAMLGDVAKGAHEWLARAGRDDALRAERLLTEVTRASSLLRQLEMYGNEQARALEPVSTRRVLRDLAPVLQRLVGDRIELVLPKTTGSFDVDVEAERLERVLVNVAGYARERMPAGGQIRIDLATTTVGRRFLARYPHVRPGDHVLVTVTELSAVDEAPGDTERSSRSADRPEVDLGALVDLIASCGGHLWLDAQPGGDMVVKMHFPKSPAATATDPEERGGRLSRWFRSKTAASVRLQSPR